MNIIRKFCVFYYSGRFYAKLRSLKLRDLETIDKIKLNKILPAHECTIKRLGPLFESTTSFNEVASNRTEIQSEYMLATALGDLI